MNLKRLEIHPNLIAVKLTEDWTNSVNSPINSNSIHKSSKGRAFKSMCYMAKEIREFEIDLRIILKIHIEG